MKKILFIFLTMFIFINVVKANEWYDTPPGDGQYEKEYRYRFYKEIKEGEYIKKGEKSEYEYEEVENIKYSKYSDYKTSCKTEEGYEVEYATKSTYQKILPVQYIKINNLGEYDLVIENLEIIANDKNYLVAHEFYSCNNCADKYTINSRGSMILEMEYPVSLDNLTFILDFFNDDSQVKYELVYSFNVNFFASDIIALIKSKPGVTKFQYDKSFYLYPNYTPTYTGYDIEIDNLTKVLSQEKVCRVREVMTYRYNIVKDYYDDNYYKDINELTNLTNEEKLEYKKDLEDYRIFYKYNKDNKEVINPENNLIKVDNNNLKLVKTGVEGKKNNYNYLIIYILILVLILLILLKYIKMSNENND